MPENEQPPQSPPAPSVFDAYFCAALTGLQPFAPCPHCGGQGEDIFTPPVENTDVIRCAECGAETEGHEPGTGEHVTAWNEGRVLTEEQATTAKRAQGFE